MQKTTDIPSSIQWKDTHITILNQQALPNITEFIDLYTIQDVFDSITSLKVRGAPAIGIAAAYGIALSASAFIGDDLLAFRKKTEEDISFLSSSRPTAVNLFWSLNRMRKKLHDASSVNGAKTDLIHEAIAIFTEDEATCRSIGEYGLTLFKPGDTVLTHCNAGGIATARYGTALAPFHLAAEKGISLRVFACETRPVLQGARLTAWELMQAGVDVTLISDNMAAHAISTQNISSIIVGADRITANGDTANKIGTLSLAVLANHFGIPFYVAAPSSTFDLSLDKGDLIPIEERDPKEITHIHGVPVAPENVSVFNPAFDVTPNHLITAIITEEGIIYPDFKKNIPNTIKN